MLRWKCPTYMREATLKVLQHTPLVLYISLVLWNIHQLHCRPNKMQLKQSLVNVWACLLPALPEIKRVPHLLNIQHISQATRGNDQRRCVLFFTAHRSGSFLARLWPQFRKLHLLELILLSLLPAFTLFKNIITRLSNSLTFNRTVSVSATYRWVTRS